MSKKIIISADARTVNPWFSSFLTLFFIGLGQFYSGFASQGIIFLLLRIIVMLALPSYSIWKPDSSLASGILISILLFITITLIAVVHSFQISRKKDLKSLWYNKNFCYLIYALSSCILTFFSIALFFSFFNLIKINNDSPPLFRKNDIIAVKKIFKSSIQRSDLILLNDKKAIVRIIALPGESVSYKGGRFTIGDYELPLSIFNENELRKISVSDYDVISEYNGTMRYPVIRGNKDITLISTLAEKEFFVSPDNRTESQLIMKILADQINLKIEGIIYSPHSGILPGTTSLPVE